MDSDRIINRVAEILLGRVNAPEGTINDVARLIVEEIAPQIGDAEKLRATKGGELFLPGKVLTLVSAARKLALHNAAEVAKTRHIHWRMPHKDDAEPGEVCCDVSACEDIALAIMDLQVAS